MSLLDDLRNLIQKAESESSLSLVQKQDLDSYLTKIGSNAEIIIWTKAGSIRGFIAFYCNDQRRETAFVTMLVVDAVDGRKGMARALVNAMISFVRSSGFRKVHLRVNQDNFAAIRLYENCGFVSVTDDEVDDVTMELVL